LLRPVAAKEIGNNAETVDIPCADNAGDAPTSTVDSSDSHTPAVGDVVECEYAGHRAQGVLFNHKWEDLCVTDEGQWGKNVVRVREASNIVKVGFCEAMPETPMLYADACPIAKAYFAKQETQPEFEVGDLVEVVSLSYGCRPAHLGKTVAIKGIRASEHVDLTTKDGVIISLKPSDLRPLSGTYAERQAKAVKFYGWKVGDKVKVVRPNEMCEDGSGAIFHTQSELDRRGDVHTVAGILDDFITLECDWLVPYCVLQPAQ
jgi:hypothetical protein